MSNAEAEKLIQRTRELRARSVKLIEHAKELRNEMTKLKADHRKRVSDSVRRTKSYNQ